mgnify:CR=1 FL=1
MSGCEIYEVTGIQFQRFSYIIHALSHRVHLPRSFSWLPDAECAVMKSVSAWATVPKDEYGDEYYQSDK